VCPASPFLSTDSRVIATGLTNFLFTYYDQNGFTIPNPLPSPYPPAGGLTLTQSQLASIREVGVSISVLSDPTVSGGQSVTRSMKITLRPRNLP
jgi:hypothetical protein